MEEKLLKILQLADLLYEKQNKIFAQIDYCADERKRLEISIRSRKDFSYLERCEIELSKNPLIKMDDVIKLFKRYIGGTSDE